MNHSENVRVKKAKERSRHITSNTYFSTYIIRKVIFFRLLKTALSFLFKYQEHYTEESYYKEQLN